MDTKNTIFIGAILLAISVAIGAFGAHGLKSLLLENNRLETFDTANKYQFYHAFAIILCGILANQYPEKNFKLISHLFLLGIIIFSGSLYILCLSNINWLGAITPLGGVLFIIAWVLLGYRIWK
jgi:uncharacterized membrane protein YgdD (TMEM256/DUF423 family)